MRLELLEIKKILLSYAKNNRKDILLWNYLISLVILHENRCNKRYWVEVFTNYINDTYCRDDFYDLYNDFFLFI